MEKLSTHFYRHEFACQDGDCPHCGGSAPIDMRVIEVLEVARARINRPMIINSGFRCLIWNRRPTALGGPGSHDGSQHPRGTAADVRRVPGIETDALAHIFEDALEEVLGRKGGGVGKYNWGVHVDVRSGNPIRWDSRG